VFTKKSITPVWKSSLTPSQHTGYNKAKQGTSPSQGPFFIFSKSSARQVLHFLLYHCFLEFQGAVYLQVKGIPMGTNPAVFYANWYLLSYELEFLVLIDTARKQFAINPAKVAWLWKHARVLTPAYPIPGDTSISDVAQFVWECFDFAGRYVDDYLAVNNPVFHLFTYLDQMFHGLHGIYPPCLNLQLSASDSFSVPFLDMRICVTVSASLLVLLSTVLYDKRTEGAFRHIKVNRFPVITSQLSRACKFNVVTSQIVRYSRLLMHYHDFVDAAAALFLDLATRCLYNPRRLLRYLEKALARFPERFAPTTFKQLLDSILLRVIARSSQALDPASQLLQHVASQRRKRLCK
jgi:hypothetical protein